MSHDTTLLNSEIVFLVLQVTSAIVRLGVSQMLCLINIFPEQNVKEEGSANVHRATFSIKCPTCGRQDADPSAVGFSASHVMQAHISN